MSEASVLGIPCDFALSENKISIRAKVSISLALEFLNRPRLATGSRLPIPVRG